MTVIGHPLALPGHDRILHDSRAPRARQADGLSYPAEWSTDHTSERPVSEQVGRALAAEQDAGRAAWAGAAAGPVDGELPRWEPDFPQHDRAGRSRWMVTLSQVLESRGQIGETATAAAD